MSGEVGKKTPKKRWIIPHVYDVTWLIYETLCHPTSITLDGAEHFVEETHFFPVYLYNHVISLIGSKTLNSDWMVSN